MNKIREIVSVQTEAEVVEACGRTLEYLCSEQCGVYTRCNVARATITDMCVNRYKEAIDEYRSLLEGVSTQTQTKSIGTRTHTLKFLLNLNYDYYVGKARLSQQNTLYLFIFKQ